MNVLIQRLQKLGWNTSKGNMKLKKLADFIMWLSYYDVVMTGLTVSLLADGKSTALRLKFRFERGV